ncbi:hypothetical protein NQ317_013248 [Molorchus minor]|uniref:Uncharacterized protein n=1 Tax=Molorchus minor TaxID=1323400 RepID=A0ABQ9JXF1_9CUCU|nr:hypothetical protein NQ317_013248 [Molorchus minor]
MGYLVGLLLCLLCISSISLGQKYSSKYDNIDIDKILSNHRVLTNYINCLMDKGPCTPEGKEFRKNIPEAITTNCVNCTDAQKRIVKKTSLYIMKNRPEDWDKIRLKFDPTEKYKESFVKFINEK